MQDEWNLFNDRTPFPQNICQGVSWNLPWELNSPVGRKVVWAHGPGKKGNNTVLTFSQHSTPAGQFGKGGNPLFNHGTERVSHFPWTTLIPDPPDPPATHPRTPQSHTLNLHFYFFVLSVLFLSSNFNISPGSPPPLKKKQHTHTNTHATLQPGEKSPAISL